MSSAKVPLLRFCGDATAEARAAVPTRGYFTLDAPRGGVDATRAAVGRPPSVPTEGAFAAAATEATAGAFDAVACTAGVRVRACPELDACDLPADAADVLGTSGDGGEVLRLRRDLLRLVLLAGAALRGLSV